MKSLIQSIFTTLGFEWNRDNQKEEENILLWEDDYLMVEIISKRNLEFAKKEISRISEINQKNFDGNGYTEITEISEKPINTKGLNIYKQELLSILELANLSKIPNIYYNGESKPLKQSKTIVYGKNHSGIFIESDNDYVKNIWFVTYNPKDIDKTNIKIGLKLIGERYNLIMVDWNREQIINLSNENEINLYFKMDSEAS